MNRAVGYFESFLRLFFSPWNFPVATDLIEGQRCFIYSAGDCPIFITAGG
jgi:hypothetical protein